MQKNQSDIEWWKQDWERKRWKKQGRKEKGIAEKNTNNFNYLKKKLKVPILRNKPEDK